MEDPTPVERGEMSVLPGIWLRVSHPPLKIPPFGWRKMPDPQSLLSATAALTKRKLNQEKQTLICFWRVGRIF